MAAIFRTNAHDLPWVDYDAAGVENGRANVRVKPLTVSARDVPPMQFVDYAPGHTDPVHSHDIDEVFIVNEGELSIDEVVSGPGSIVFISRDTEYAVRAGAEGVQYFRVVFPG